MSNKRQLQISPSEKTSNNKKYISSNMPSEDKFSWKMMSEMLDESLHKKLNETLDVKLADVARKEDINDIKTELNEVKDAMRNELNEVKAENSKLRAEISKLSSRLENIDHKTRQSSVVVNGLDSDNPNDAKTEFKKLCSVVLNVNANVVHCGKLGRKSYIFNLESSMMTQNLLAARTKLKGKSIYIQRDFTAQEQHTRFKLRQISKNLREKNKSLKVRLGDFSMFVNDKKFVWNDNKVIAYSTSDAEFLRNIFIQCNINEDIDINLKSKSTHSE